MTTPIKKQLEKDEVLQGIMSNITLAERASTKNVFHDLMSCIIEQQIHYRSTKKMFQKMLDSVGMNELNVKNFPDFEKAFLNVKLSERKYETIARIVEFFENEEIDWFTLSDEEVRKTLTQIKGIGPWTMDMILLYTLERPDIFPADDYHLKGMMTELYDIDTSAKVKAQLKAVAEDWAPYRSSGVRYLLEWKDFLKKKK